MSKHEEFPELTPAAQAAYEAAIGAIRSDEDTISPNDFRRALAACLREAMEQAHRDGIDPGGHYCPYYLRAMVRNLHNPPPPPPTLAEARKADLHTPEGRATADVFLANLAAETQT